MSIPESASVRVPTLPGSDFNLPRGLEGLDELAYNLWWSWTPRAGTLFSRLDPAAWTRHGRVRRIWSGRSASASRAACSTPCSPACRRTLPGSGAF